LGPSAFKTGHEGGHVLPCGGGGKGDPGRKAQNERCEE